MHSMQVAVNQSDVVTMTASQSELQTLGGNWTVNAKDEELKKSNPAPVNVAISAVFTHETAETKCPNRRLCPSLSLYQPEIELLNWPDWSSSGGRLILIKLCSGL